MKRALLTFHFMFFVPIIAFLHAQERPFIPDSLRILLQNDSLHITRPASLAPWIGEEIDQSEKAEYGLFRWLDDASFMSAKIFHTSDTSLVIAIYLWDGQTQVKHISPYRFQQMQWHVCDIYYSKHPMEDTLRKYSMTSAEVYTLRYTAEDPDGYSYDSPAVQFWPIGSDDHIACPYYTDFLYLHAQVGDRFAVCYRNDKPGDFEMYTNEPLLDPDDPVDTTVATITALNPPGLLDDEETVEFKYGPFRVYKKNTLTRTQDFAGFYKNGIAQDRPDLVKGRKFYVVYSKKDPSKCVLLPDHPADSGKYFYHPQKNMVSTGMFPVFKFRIDYTRVINKDIAAGVSTTIWYPNSHMLGSLTQGMVDTLARGYDPDYYYKFSRFITTSPFIEYYPTHNAPYTFCIRFWATYAEADGMHVNYANREGAAKLGDGIFDYLDRDSLHSAYFSTASFNTWGLGTAAYFKMFLDSRYRWQFYWSLGYRYLHLPKEIKQPRNIEGTEYYYYDFPVWTDALHFPLVSEWGFSFKF